MARDRGHHWASDDVRPVAVVSDDPKDSWVDRAAAGWDDRC
jgi:hypothetical protein